MLRILIFEDDPQIRGFLREALSQAGYEVLEATNGSEGWRLYIQEPVDLVITDILMPEQEGLETIRQLQSHSHPLHIIAISGGMKNLGINVLEMASKLGAHKTLEKPIELSTLVQAVKELIGPAE